MIKARNKPCINRIGSEQISRIVLIFEFSFRVLSAGRQLAKSLELQSLNDLGFSKRYVRCLQVHRLYVCGR